MNSFVTCLEPEPFITAVLTTFSVVALIACVVCTRLYERDVIYYINMKDCFWSTQNVWHKLPCKWSIQYAFLCVLVSSLMNSLWPPFFPQSWVDECRPVQPAQQSFPVTSQHQLAEFTTLLCWHVARPVSTFLDLKCFLLIGRHLAVVDKY